MAKFGLIGERLGHSYSPQIHKLLHENEYGLYELSSGGLADFFSSAGVDGVNVTIPFKKTVMPFCSKLSEEAEKIGSVNTMVREGGCWTGHNTDYYGFSYMVRESGFSVSGKKAIIFGSGGASLTVRAVLEDMGASEIVVVSRGGEYNYENLYLHRDAKMVVNATPVGMYPHNMEAPADISVLEGCEIVFDLIYNPARTALLMQAESLGIKGVNGLSMLVAQAKRSAELFLDRAFCDGEIDRVTSELSSRMENIVLVGMPGCGKTTVGKALTGQLSRELYDSDEEIIKEAGMSIPQIFEQHGEEHFRRLETRVIERLGKKSGIIIATGGGCVTRAENYPLLHQNGRIFWIKRDPSLLPDAGRPISQRVGGAELYKMREACYTRFADFETENNGDMLSCCQRIKESV